MNLIERISELVKYLEWALDLIDMYDERLAKLDGFAMVYTKTHTRMKEQARDLVKGYKGK